MMNCPKLCGTPYGRKILSNELTSILHQQLLGIKIPPMIAKKIIIGGLFCYARFLRTCTGCNWGLHRLMRYFVITMFLVASPIARIIRKSFSSSSFPFFETASCNERIQQHEYHCNTRKKQVCAFCGGVK